MITSSMTKGLLVQSIKNTDAVSTVMESRICKEEFLKLEYTFYQLNAIRDIISWLLPLISKACEPPEYTYIHLMHIVFMSLT